MWPFPPFILVIKVLDNSVILGINLIGALIFFINVFVFNSWCDDKIVTIEKLNDIVTSIRGNKQMEEMSV
jgi:hypothetical protein